MTRAIAPVAALLLSVAIMLMGNGLQTTLLPVRANLEHFSNTALGVLGSVYFLGFAVGCFFGAHVIRRAGHIRAFAAIVSLASTVALAHVLLVDVVSWWFLRFISGFCFATLFMIIESWLNERSTNETRGLVFSVYAIINLTVITLGQMMIVFDDPKDFQLFALSSILVSLAAVPVALTTSQAPAPITSTKIRLKRLFRMSPVGFIGCLAVGLANGSFWGLAPVFAQNVGLSLTGIALFMSLTVIGGAVGQWPLGLASQQTDRRLVIIGASLAAAVSAVLLYLSGVEWIYGLLAFGFSFGFFAFPVYAISVAHANDFAAQTDYVEVSSGLLLVFGAGAFMGPILASQAVDFVGPGGLFLYTATIHVLLAGFALYRKSRRTAPLEEEHTSFPEALVSAQTVSVIDMRDQSTATPEGPATAGGAADSAGTGSAGSSVAD